MAISPESTMGDTDRPPASAPVPLVPGSRLGVYELVGVIGKGGMGMVWEARHTTLGKRVAIKTLKHDLIDNADLVSRFMREARAASALRHENAVDVTDVSEAGGTPFFVMDFLEGEPLAKRMHDHGALPIKDAVNIAIPILAALGRAHELGIVHRDIKPGNIFLANDSSGAVRPMLVDFGISKVASDDEEHLTRDASFMGTPHYAAPEQTYDTKGVDARADQYAIGVVLYEMIAGRRPFFGKTSIDVVIAMREGKFSPLDLVAPRCPRELAAQIHKAMSVLPTDRYSSVREFGGALLPWASLRVRTVYAKSFGLNDITGSTDLAALGLHTPPNGLDLLDEDVADAPGAPPSSLPPATKPTRTPTAATPAADTTSKFGIAGPAEGSRRKTLLLFATCLLLGTAIGSTWLVATRDSSPNTQAPTPSEPAAQPAPIAQPLNAQPTAANVVAAPTPANEAADAAVPIPVADPAAGLGPQTGAEPENRTEKARIRPRGRVTKQVSTPPSTGRTVFPLD